ncbi:MAG: hypothetical protein AAFR49_20505 [Pseudomonadota bacterium]
MLTVNTHGAPGGRVSLRLKPTAGALDTVGGAGNLTTALDAAIEEVAERIDDHDWFAQTLLGSSP